MEGAPKEKVRVNGQEGVRYKVDSVPAYLRGCTRKDEAKLLRYLDAREGRAMKTLREAHEKICRNLQLLRNIQMTRKYWQCSIR